MQARVQRFAAAIAITFFAMASTAPLACDCGRGGRDLTILVPASMQRTGPQTAEPDGSVTLWGNGTLEAAVALAGGPLQVTVVARGTAAANEWPQVYIRLDSRIVASVTIDAIAFADYTVQFDAPRAGPSVLAISLTNHVTVPDRLLAGRNLVVQQVRVRQLQSR